VCTKSYQLNAQRATPRLRAETRQDACSDVDSSLIQSGKSDQTIATRKSYTERTVLLKCLKI